MRRIELDHEIHGVVDAEEFQKAYAKFRGIYPPRKGIPVSEQAEHADDVHRTNADLPESKKERRDFANRYVKKTKAKRWSPLVLLVR